MIRAMIVDIDGTLADCNHRRHYLERSPKDWPAFYEAMSLDRWNEAVGQVASTLSRFYDVLLVTGRPEEYREKTERWLRDNHNYSWFEHRGLFMRRIGDFRPDTEVKREIYLEQIAPRYKVELVLDDRASVVKMWRGQGLQCWQVAEGDF